MAIYLSMETLRGDKYFLTELQAEHKHEITVSFKGCKAVNLLSERKVKEI